MPFPTYYPNYNQTIPNYANYYQPVTTNPQPDVRQNQYSSNNQPFTTRQSIQTSLMWANDEKEAENALVMANNTVIIMLKDMSKFYIKSADNIGRQTMDVYKCEKVSYNAENLPKQPEKKEKHIDVDNFATKEELAKLREKIENNDDYITRRELDDILGSISVSTKVKKAKVKGDEEE